MKPVPRYAMHVIEIEIRRTERLFRWGRAYMACVLSGSAIVVAAMVARLVTGI